MTAQTIYIEHLDLLIGLEYCMHFFIHPSSNLFSLIGLQRILYHKNKSTMQEI